MGRGGRIFAMTSAGSRSVLPSYGAVSAAKAALESHVRQLAVELAPLGVTANAILAGVTDTPALRRIPGHERLIERALAGNPHGRLTTPEDVAAALVELARSGWVESVPVEDFQPDDTATITFDEPGVYPYYCSLHGTPSAGMDGRIRVVEG